MIPPNSTHVSLLSLSLLVFLLSCGSPLLAIELGNAGFEVDLRDSAGQSEWEIQNYGQEVERDLGIKSDGSASLRINSSSPQSSAMLRQSFSAESVRNGVVRLSGKIRTEEMRGTATLFVTVNDSNTRIFLDDMRGRPIQGTSDWTAVEIRVPRMLDAQTMEVGLLVIGSGTAWFDELSLDRVEFSDSTSGVAADYLQEVLDLIEERSIHSPAADWDAVRDNAQKAAAGSQSQADVYPTIRYILRKLGDTHSSLFTPERAQRITSEGSDSTNLPKWESPSGSIVEERFAYINIPKFLGTNPERMTAFADEMQGRIKELDSEMLCGWIVDLRQNMGGNVFPMLAGIGPILGEGDAGGGRAVDGTEVKRFYADGRAGKATISGDAYELLKSSPSVAVLLGPNTASSGEAVALAFVGRSNTKTFGSPTAGYTTGNVPIPLSDGAILNLAVTNMMDRDGNIYSGPIAPDVAIDADANADPNTDAVVQEAVTWLETNTACLGTR